MYRRFSDLEKPEKRAMVMVAIIARTSYTVQMHGEEEMKARAMKMSTFLSSSNA